MKRAMIVVLCAALAISGAAPAFAQSSRSRGAQASVSVTVVRIRSYFSPDDIVQVPQKYRYPSPQTIAQAQQEIRNNAAIRAVLQRKRISAFNVVGVQTALNGGKIVYVR
ncbi:hypothetical protein JNB71_04900 [Rhizobium herbae]|uniref:DUF541 domain-containing protein n=1 Tax=Rhizobium herbae TaxID=508661 RepID=A0ABS7H5X9_9HYPH|nr:hypothetical protein [Rhizobium herbae]MBW9062647.1 hypothetical protein [Rhizobium herbae]